VRPSYKPAAIAHGGVGTSPDAADGCQRAVDAALAALAGGADPLEAAVAAVVVLEDDPRFNAGTGSIVRLDGSVQMDASVMDSDGRFGAVANIERVKNPVTVARGVLETPHLLLAGDGATAFARSLGIPEHDPATAARRGETEQLKRKLRLGGDDLPAFWRTSAFRERWNYPLSPAALGLDRESSDTVGAAVRAADGRFAAALSTGGSAIMLRGRVGDVPLFGAGLYAGPNGAAAATGTGERITERLLAHTVHRWLGEGVPAQEAARRAVASIAQAPVGIVVITRTELAAAADRPMAWAARED
jgi:L-asparaginase / beta-aspartyl-peptidase